MADDPSSHDATIRAPQGPGPETRSFAERHGPRFVPKSELGRGGIGRVVEAEDSDIGRTVALKLLLPGTTAETMERFLWEARVTGRLEHPNIVPVHEMGVMPGTREPFFCMKRIAGRNMQQVIVEERETSLRRLVEAFRDVCRAIAYAHSKGIVHRDLKPSNVMLGEFGEVLVVDWGLAKDVRGAQATEVMGPLAAAATGESTSRTLDGDVIGTPAYMSPEQARGLVADIDERSDVYSLGAILYEVLSGRPPFRGRTVMDVLVGAIEKAPDSPSRGRTDVPPDLEAICLRALAKKKEERFQTAAELAREVDAWLEGSKEADRRRREADELARQAAGDIARWRRLRDEAEDAARRARARGDEVKPHEPIERKRPTWAEEDRARGLQQEAVDAFTAADLALAQALAQVPRHAEAARLRAELAWEHFLEIESSPDAKSVQHARRLAERFNDGSLDARLKGDGSLEVRTRAYGCRCLVDGRDVSAEEIGFAGVWEAPEAMRLRVHGASCAPAELAGAEVWAFRYEERDRALVPVTAGSGSPPVPDGVLDELFGSSPYRPVGAGHYLGRTPIAPRAWPMGSWLLVFAAPGRAPLRVPVCVRRQENVVVNATMYAPGELPAGFQPISAGRFLFQGDASNPYSEPAAFLDLDDALVARFPVTCREYAEFLTALPEEESTLRTPRESTTAPPAWPRVGGRVVVPTAAWRAAASEADRARAIPLWYGGLDWEEEWPAASITWPDACAYAKWASRRDGRLYGLPPEALWEKAARGPDGRMYPWGKDAEPARSNGHTSKEKMSPSPVDSFPGDESPYGVRGMGGNIADWCLDEIERAGRRWIVIRGGAWPQAPQSAKTSYRIVGTKIYLNFTIGFRLACAVRVGK